MARRLCKKLDKAIEREICEKLLKEFKSVNSSDDVDNFFSKFMTSKEKELIFRRLAVIKFINQGKKYREIKDIMEISGNTISNVRDILEGRGYSRNPSRKRIYSSDKYKNYKPKPKFVRKYKGAVGIQDWF